MNYRNYSDEQLVDNATPGQGQSLEMMRRLKNSLEKLDNSEVYPIVKTKISPR